LKLVIDASVVAAAAANRVGFERFRRFELIATASEVRRLEPHWLRRLSGLALAETVRDPG
jgi:hypothetical protein